MSSIFEFFVRLLGLRDAYTRGHTERGVFYALEIGKALGLTGKELKFLELGGYIHDIGKIAIPDVILLKPGKLTREEYEVMKLHVELGYEMVKDLDIPQESLDVLLYHQERYDGKGYPFGLKGKDIPLLARIYTIADSFEAMTSRRIYKRAKSWNRALEELVELKGKQFDPDIVDYAVKTLSKISYIPLENKFYPESLEKIRWSFYYLDFTGAVKGELFLPSLEGFITKGEPFCLTFFDIENLFEINKRYGWEEGNKVLKKLVDLINVSCCGMLDVREIIMRLMKGDVKEILRPVIFRIGGDEIAVIAPYIPPVEKVLGVVNAMKEEGVNVKFVQLRYPENFKSVSEVLEVMRNFFKRKFPKEFRKAQGA